MFKQTIINVAAWIFIGGACFGIITASVCPWVSDTLLDIRDRKNDCDEDLRANRDKTTLIDYENGRLDIDIIIKGDKRP